MIVTIKNIKNIQYREFNLSNFNFLIGLNGAGKTALMEGLSIAINGQDLAGHRLTKDILKLSPTDNLSVFVTIGDFSFERKMYHEDGSNKTELTINGEKRKIAEGESDIRKHMGKMMEKISIREFIDMSGKEIAQMLFGLFADDIKGNIDDFLFECKKEILSIDSTIEDTAMLDFNCKLESAGDKLPDIIEKTMSKLKVLRPNIYSAMELLNDKIEEAYEDKFKPLSKNSDASIYKFITILLPMIDNLASDINSDKRNKKGALRDATEKLPPKDVDKNIVKEQIKQETKVKDKIAKEMTRAEEKNKSIEKLKDKIAKLEKELKEEKIFGIDPVEVKKTIEKLKKQRNEIELPFTEEKYKQHQNSISRIEGSITRIKEMKRDVGYKEKKEELEKLEVALKDVDKKIKELESKKDDLKDGQKEANRFQQEHDLVLKDIIGLEEQLEAMRSGQCPTCHTVTEEMPFEIEDVEKDLEKAKKRSDGLADKVTKAEKKLQKKKSLEDQLKAKKEYRDKTEKKMTALSADIKQFNDLKKRLEKEEEKLKKYDEIRPKIAEYDKKAAKIKEINHQIEKESHIQDQLDKKKKYENLKKELKEMGDPIKTEGIENRIKTSREKLKKLEETKEAVIKRETKQESLDQMRKDLTRLETEYKIVKGAKDAFLEIKKSLVEDPIQKAVVEAQKIIHRVNPTWDVYLEPDDAGLIKENEKREKSLLSGGEVILFSMSLLFGLMISSEAKYKMLIVEGSELDSRNLYKIMGALAPEKEMDTVLLASHVQPKNKDGELSVPDGWQEIEFNK